MNERARGCGKMRWNVEHNQLTALDKRRFSVYNTTVIPHSTTTQLPLNYHSTATHLLLNCLIILCNTRPSEMQHSLYACTVVQCLQRLS